MGAGMAVNLHTEGVLSLVYNRSRSRCAEFVKTCPVDIAPGFKLVLHQKDLQIGKAMLAEYDVQLPMVEMSLILYQCLIDEGFADEDISTLFRHKQRMFQESAD